MTATIVDQNWLNANRNKKVDDSALERTCDYLSTANGAYRGLQSVEKTIQIGNEFSNQLGAHSAQFVRDLGTATAAMGMCRLPSVTSQVIKSLSAIGDQKNPTDMSRKMANAVKDTADAVLTYGYTGAFITKNTPLAIVANIADLTCNVTDVTLSVTDYTSAAKLESAASGQIKEAITHSKNYYLFRIIKATLSIASGILGLTMVALGAPLLPALALIILSVTTTIFAVMRDNYKYMGQFRVIDFDRAVTIG